MKRLTKLLFLGTALVLGCTGKVWAGDYSNNAQLTANANPTGQGTVYVTLAERDDEGNWTGKHGENVLSSYKATSASGKKNLGSGVTGYFSAYAKPNRGYAFDSWSDLAGSGNPALAWSSSATDNPIFVQVTATTDSKGNSNDATIQANFITNPISAFPVKYEAPAQAGCTYTAVAAEGDYGSITIDGTTEYTTWNTDYITLTATPATGWQFYRWIVKDENGIKETLGEAIVNPLLTTLPAHARTVTAEFITPANFIVGEATFMEFADALQYAATSAVGGEKVIILQLKDYIVPAGYYTIPEGVTLLIPWSINQTKPAGTSPGHENTTAAASQYRMLTLSSGVTINVFGTIEIGGRQNDYSTSNTGTGRNYGGYGRLHMSEGSTMTLNSGANLMAWGFVTGQGEIDARRGSVCHEFFQIYDFRGGSATSGYANWDGSAKDKGIFPLNQYYIQNIEVPVTFHPGARETATMAAVQTQIPGVGIIGIRNKLNGEEDDIAMFLMDDQNDSEDTWVRKDYDEEHDRQKYDINSSAYLSNIKFTVAGVAFNSGEGYVLPITNNIDIHLLSGEMGIIQDVAFFPGSSLEVEKEATAYIKEGKTVYFYDSDDWGTYAYNGGYSNPIKHTPSWTKCPRDVSSPAKIGDAHLKIHGTFLANGYIYTTTGGADITSTNEDAGTIIFNTTAPTEQKSIWQSPMKYDQAVEAKANPAWLQNGVTDPAYAETAGTAAGKSYCYRNDKWTLMDVDADNDCFMLDNYGVYYAKPGEYVAINATKDPESKVISGNADHTFSDYAGEGRLFILMDDCQWWEVEFENNRYHRKVEAGSSEAPKYYEYDEEQGKWVDYRYTITWKNGDDVIATYKLTAGTEPKYLGTNPTRPEDIDYTYNFVGWTPALTTVIGDATYTATYDAVEKRYLIRFINENGGEIERHFLRRGEMPVCSDVPNKAGHYLVWSPTIAQVTGAQDYTATYLAEEPTEFTVTWKNFDGTEIYHETVAKDATPSYDAATYGTPAKTVSGSEYNYTFTGWSPTVAAVTADVAYTAQFSQAKKTFAIRFMNENGTQISETQNVEAGAMPIIPACDKINPVEGHVYTLVWSPLVVAASKAQDYTATFTDEINKYTVTLIGNGCSVTGSGTYNHGTNVTITATANPGREFVKWSDDNTTNPRTLTVTGPVTLSAVTNSVPVVVSDTEDKTIKSPMTVEDVVISASEETSGQLFGTENLNITGNVYFDYTFNGKAYNRAKQNWYAFAVPFEVDATALQYKKSDGTYAPCGLGTAIDIIYYNGQKRAEQGANVNAWDYVEDLEDKTLYPGKLYLATFSSNVYAGTVRFPKKTTAALVSSNSITTVEHASAITTDANWNGIANPALHYSALQAAGVDVGHLYSYDDEKGEADYDEIPLSNVVLSVGKPIFVQATTGTASASQVARPSSPASAPARTTATTKSDMIEVRISDMEAQKHSDRLYVKVDEEAQDEYTIGADVAKAGVATKRAQIWVDNYNSKLCLNTIAPQNDCAEWQLGIYAPQSGDYVIKQASVSEGTLYLTQNGAAIWNLSMGEYAGYFDAGTDNSYGLRLVLQAPGVVTSLEEASVNNNGVGAQKIILEDRMLIIRDGKVYDAQGKWLK